MKKIINMLTGIVLFALYCGFLAFCINKIPMNSDGACMLLEAEDILSGNVFLSDWHLTGISFLTTDLPWYILGTALFGVSLKAFHTAVWLMVVFMTVCALPLVFHNSKNRLLSVLIFSAVGLFPTNYVLSNAFVHTGVFGLCFLSAYIFQLYQENPSTKSAVALGVVTALAVCGDRTSLAIIVLPVLVLCIFCAVPKHHKPAISVSLGTIAGFGIEKLFLLMGGANLNGMSRTFFSEMEYIPGNIGLYIDYCLKILNASLFGKPLFSVKTGVFALKICIALAAVALMCRAIYAVLKKRDTDIPCAMFGIGFFTVSAILWLSDMSLDITAGRYICFLPIMLALCIVRVANFIPEPDRKIKIGVYVCLSALIMVNFIPHGSDFSSCNVKSRMAVFLEEQNLTRGYASFWDASVITGYSEGKVTVNPVKCTNEGVAPRLWFCKQTEYEKPAQFVIISAREDRREEDIYNYNGIFNANLAPNEIHGKTYEMPFTYEAVLDALGQPVYVKQFENYDILIYENVSDLLTEENY